MLNPFLMGCTCTKLTDAELNHLFLIGDKLWQETLADNEWCIGQGFTKAKDDAVR